MISQREVSPRGQSHPGEQPGISGRYAPGVKEGRDINCLYMEFVLGVSYVPKLAASIKLTWAEKSGISTVSTKIRRNAIGERRKLQGPG